MPWFWDVVGIVLVGTFLAGLMILWVELAPPVWPKLACRRSEGVWRVEVGYLATGVRVAPRYYRVAPGWFRFVTMMVKGWYWVKL